jgi:hypothetical protein
LLKCYDAYDQGASKIFFRELLFAINMKLEAAAAILTWENGENRRHGIGICVTIQKASQILSKNYDNY